MIFGFETFEDFRFFVDCFTIYFILICIIGYILYKFFN